MGDGDLDFSNPEVFAGPNSGEDLPSSCQMDSFFEDIFEDTQQHHACTHTHTCNPPGPDLSHTHTCFHVHTKILSASTDETAESSEKSSSTKKRPCGNREAVRKYREKKKAHAASLEEEIVQLRAMNQQLMKRLQNQSALEAEVMRLRCLLVDLRGRIEVEIGSFPYQRPAKGGGVISSKAGDMVPNGSQVNMLGGAQVLNSCGFSCDDQGYCFRPGVQGKYVGGNGSLNDQGFGECQINNMQCMKHPTSAYKEFSGCGNGAAASADCLSNANKIEGSELSGQFDGCEPQTRR